MLLWILRRVLQGVSCDFFVCVGACIIRLGFCFRHLQLRCLRDFGCSASAEVHGVASFRLSTLRLRACVGSFWGGFPVLGLRAIWLPIVNCHVSC